MAEYSYKAATMDGKVVEGTMDASDHGAVSLRLQEMSLIPIRVGAAAKSTFLTRDIPWPWKRRRVRRKDLLVFTHELHTLVKSGIPLDRALAVLAKLAESPALSEVIQNVLRGVKGGKSFSEALGEYPQVFPKVYVNMVHAGEVGGVLEDILGQRADRSRPALRGCRGQHHHHDGVCRAALFRRVPGHGSAAAAADGNPSAAERLPQQLLVAGGVRDPAHELLPEPFSQ
jgi:type II secretory pathway component PulF